MLVELPKPFDFELSTERFRAFGLVVNRPFGPLRRVGERATIHELSSTAADRPGVHCDMSSSESDDGSGRARHAHARRAGVGSRRDLRDGSKHLGGVGISRALAAVAGALLALAIFAAGATATTARVRVELVSVTLDGHPAGRMSVRPRVSDDGRVAVFGSQSEGIVPGSRGRMQLGSQLYARDLVRDVTTLVSARSDGTPASGGTFLDLGAISGDGRLVAFGTDSENLSASGSTSWQYLYVKHVRTGALEATRAPMGPPEVGGQPMGVLPRGMSADGRFVAIRGYFPSAPFEIAETAYLHDRRTGSWQQICPPAFDCEAYELSGDGRYVAYEFKQAPGWEPRPRPYLFDRLTGTSRQVPFGPATPDLFVQAMALSGNGRVLVVTWARHVPFYEAVGVVYRTRDLAVIDRVRLPGPYPDFFWIDAVDRTGRHLAVSNGEANVYDRKTDTLTRMSVTIDGGPSNATSNASDITANGSRILITSEASNLVPGDRFIPSGEGWDSFVATLERPESRARIRKDWRDPRAWLP